MSSSNHYRIEFQVGLDYYNQWFLHECCKSLREAKKIARSYKKLCKNNVKVIKVTYETIILYPRTK